MMWFAYKENTAQWHVLPVSRVKEIIEENKKGLKISSVEDFSVEISSSREKITDFKDTIGQESLTRFDTPKKKKNNRSKNKNRKSASKKNEKNK